MKNDWPVKKLGEVIIKSVNSPKVKKEEYKTEGKFPIIDQSQSFISGYSDDSSLTYKGDMPVIIFGDHTQVIKYIDKPFVRGADGTKIINPDKKIVNPSFLFYSLSSLKLKNHGYSRHYQYLIEEEVIVPPLDIQGKIVERLDEIRKAQELIDLQIQKTEELFNSIINKEFFGNNWVFKPLNEISLVTSSKRIYQSDYVNKGIPFYRTKEVAELSKGNPISLELFISESKFNDIDRKFGIPHKEDLLISAVGTIGITWIVEDDRRFYFKDGNLLWIKNFSEINSKFLKYFLDYSFNSISRMAAGGAYKALTIVNLKKMMVPIPGLNQQKKIIEKLDAVQDYKKHLQKQKQLYKELFDSVLDKSMSGEMD